MTKRSLSLEEARAVATAAQGLRSRGEGSPAELVERYGFLRTLGGVDAYLALHQRGEGITREGVDAAVAAHELQIVPTVRGCIYLVARQEVAWSLRLADLLSRRRNERDQEKAGIEPGELEPLGEAVLEALRREGPLSTTALRRALPYDAIRSLGDAGKKVGISSTLPPALRELEFAGEIERTPEDGRVDHEQYLWRIPDENPLAGVEGLDDEATVHRHFAERFFRWAGLGTVDSFAAWSGLGKRDSRAAMNGLELAEVTVEGREDGPYLALDEALEAAGAGGDGGAVALLPFIDNLPHLQGGPGLFVDPAHHDIPVPVWGRGKGTTLGDARHMSYRSVVAGDKVVGFWEYDPDTGEIVWACVDPPKAAVREAVANRAVELAAFVRDQLGHGKSFSIDTDDDLRRRAAEIRELAGD